MSRRARCVVGVVVALIATSVVADSHKSPGGIITAPVGKATGKLTVQFVLFDSKRGGCTTVRGYPEVWVDGALVNPGPPNLGRRFSTGNPLSTGYALEINRIPAGRHVVNVSVAGGCAGFGWLPSARQRVNLIEGNRYTGVVRFTYNRVLSAPLPKLPVKPRLQLR